MALHTLSLFSGAGGLDLGLKLAVPDSESLCYVEREAYAAACLVARMQEGSLAQAPIWSDVSTFDGTPWAGTVDLICGGFPCQDISVAGKGEGITGARSGLWKQYARIVSEVRPCYIFIENVSALRTNGLETVLQDIASLGYDAVWGNYRASDVGAPHKRERIFILAHTQHSAVRDEQRWSARSHWQDQTSAGDLGKQMAYPDQQRQQVIRHAGLQRSELQHANGQSSQKLGNPDLSGLEGWQQSVTQRQHQQLAWTPGPEDDWSVFRDMFPELEPSFCRAHHGVADGMEFRVDRLRALGNGVVPQVAAVAFWDLMVALHGSLS